MSKSDQPFSPGPANDTIDLEQIGVGGAMNIDSENEPDFALRRGQLVEIKLYALVGGTSEGQRSSANTILTFRKWGMKATDLIEINLLEQPEARVQKNGQIDGQLDLNGKEREDQEEPEPGIGLDNPTVADAVRAAVLPPSERALYTQPDGSIIAQGSRWQHVENGKTYRAQAHATSGDEQMIYVVDTATDAEDAFPVQSFGSSLVCLDGLQETHFEPPAAPEPALDPAGAPVGHPDDVKAAFGDEV